MKRSASVLLGVLLVAAPVAARTTSKATAKTAPRGAASTLVAEVGASAGESMKPRSEPLSPQPGTRDSADYTIKSGQDGAVFRSLTVQGEDRIHVEFERPALSVDLDPEKAPGLDIGSARDVLDRTSPDFAAPMVAGSARVASRWTARPWLSHFATGAVARFRPAVKGIERWKLVVANSKGESVASWQGRSEPPREIAWDGRSQSGAPVSPGLTYSYVLEAYDRAGNKRNFVGQGFTVTAYRFDGPHGPTLVFSARELGTTATAPHRPGAGNEATAPIVLEAATWLNQTPGTPKPIRVTVMARSFDQANALAASVARQLAPHLLGDPARIQIAVDVQPDAPADGTVRIGATR